MKLRFLLVMSLVLTGIIACSETEDLSNIQEENVSTYMTVKVTGNLLSGTRTLPEKDATGGGEETGIEEENKISNLLVLLYDNADVLKKAFVTKVMNNTDEGAETAVFQMPTGIYKVFVIANFSEREEAWATMPGLDVKNLVIEDITNLLMQRNYAKEYQFMMFNQCNGADKTEGVPIEITAANTARNPATCTIRLDRLAVKLRTRLGTLDLTEMKQKLPTDLFKEVDVKLKAIKLMNGAKQCYLQQHWTNNQPNTFPYKNTLITPWLVSGENPVLFNYYAKYSDFRTIIYDAEGEYEYVRDNFALMDFYSDAVGPIYCMENNPTWNGTSVSDAMKGNTTGLVYQFLMHFKGSDNIAGTNCFYGFSGKYFPTLESLQLNFPYVFEKASSSLNSADDLAAAKLELQTAYAAADIYEGIAKFRAKYKIKVYMDGLMYYIYYIKDKNYVEGDKHYYAVMRNTIYDLTVKELLRIGEDVPGGWNPDTRPIDPVDPTNTYMNVIVKVNPWVLNKEDISLK